MTVTVKVHVNGNYRCLVTPPGQDPVWVGPNEERSFTPPHPVENVEFKLGPEEYLGELWKPSEE
jgi:hypothetical protein